jgi:hypothetical protein
MLRREGQQPRQVIAIGMLLFTTTIGVSGQTIDQSRLSIGVSIGKIWSGYSWDVPYQLIQSSAVIKPPSNPFLPDSFHLRQEIRSSAAISAHVMYFPQAHVGVTGEFSYLGLGTTSSCIVVADNGDPDLVAACNAVNQNPKSASTATIQGGIVVRPLAHAVLQPYVAGLAGVALMPVSPVALATTYGGGNSLTIYTDDSWQGVRPTGALAAGFAAGAGVAYLVRFELRETWMSLPTATGPTAAQGSRPPTRAAITGFPSATLGVDIVLGKRRGKRY